MTLSLFVHEKRRNLVTTHHRLRLYNQFTLRVKVLLADIKWIQYERENVM